MHKFYTDYESLINTVAIKNRIESKEVIKIMHHVLKETKGCMSDDLLPNILLENFARLKPRLNDVTKQLKKLNNSVNISVNNNYSPITVATKLERLQTLYDSYYRLLKEDNLESKVDLDYILETIDKHKNYGSEN